jgi:hypothetical protein
MEKSMTIQSKPTKLIVNTVCKAVCDNCKNDLDSVTLYDEAKKTEYQTLETGGFSLDGINLKFKAGYGTTYDMSNFQITLCTNCLADMVKQFGGVIRQ